MRSSVLLLAAVALASLGASALSQSPTPANHDEPVLKRCTDTTPPPCADKPPVAIHAPDPGYSKQAAKAKINGTVVLAVVVGTDGRAHNISVLKSLGYGLDEEAIKAVKKWRFKPGQSSGKPVAVEIRVESEFHYPYQMQ